MTAKQWFTDHLGQAVTSDGTLTNNGQRVRTHARTITMKPGGWYGPRLALDDSAILFIDTRVLSADDTHLSIENWYEGTQVSTVTYTIVGR